MKLWIKAAIVWTVVFAAIYLLTDPFENDLGTNLFALFMYLLGFVLAWVKIGE